MAKTLFGVPLQFLMFILAGIVGGVAGMILGYGIGMVGSLILGVAGLTTAAVGLMALFTLLGMVLGWYVAWRIYEKLR